ncbi:hypothetical protein COL922a_009168 [Colletotrichum nupharicola]|nr:hypothetical protein COL922a_009168 [Colletotrichum nupharicola]
MRRVQGRLPATNIVLAEEQDAEDQKEDRNVTINVPEETDFADAAVNYIEAAADIPYATAAKIAMNLMMSHELGQYRPQGMETCALCEENDSVDDDKKRHAYTVGHLHEHVASDFHAPFKQWIRRAHQDRDARMAADLDDRDFTSAGTTRTGRGTTQRAKTQLAARKIEAQKSDSRKRKFEQPVPVPGQSGIVWAQPGHDVGEDLENPGPGITFGAALGSSGYKPSIKPIPGVITNASPPGSPGWKPTFTKPPRGAYYVARPGTFRNMPGDGHLISDRLKDRHK